MPTDGKVMALRHMQIGEVAHQTGLSLRTIRYYEEVDLVVPSARTAGGFRLYTDSDVARLQLIKRMKPLDFTLDETRDLLANLDALDSVESQADRATFLARLESYQQAAQKRIESVRRQLEFADEFASELRAEITRQQRASEART